MKDDTRNIVSTLLDDLVAADHVCRVVDAFVNGNGGACFKRAQTASFVAASYGLRRASFCTRPVQKRKSSSSHFEAHMKPKISLARKLSAGFPE